MKAYGKDPHFSFVRTEFNPAYEQEIREKTVGIKPKRGALGTQDRLIYCFGTINPCTGASYEFGWASGRRDVLAQLDIDFDAMVMNWGYEKACQLIEERRAEVVKLKEKYNGQGFEHYEYEGGFEKFALNFERATGQRVPNQIDQLCAVELRQAA